MNEHTQNQEPSPPPLAVAKATEDTSRIKREIGVFESAAAFSHAQRVSKMLCLSSLMPESFRGEENLGSVVIIMDIAMRLKLNPLLVAQQIYIVYGKPAFSAQFLIAVCNTNADFGKIRYDMKDNGEKTFEYQYTEGFGQQKQRKAGKATVHDMECVAWALEGKDQRLPDGVNTLAKAKEAGLAILEGPPVSITMSVQEGWWAKDGSKWKTLPELMLRYRAASFFVRLYGPELLMGLPTVDELEDMGPHETVTRPIFDSKPVQEPAKTLPAAEPVAAPEVFAPKTTVESPNVITTPPTPLAAPAQRQENNGMNPIKAIRGLLKNEKLPESVLIDFLHGTESVPDEFNSLEEIQLNSDVALVMVVEQWSEVVKRLREVAAATKK